MPTSVENELDAQMREYPTVKVALPYYDRRDKPAERFRPMTVELIFSREAKDEVKFINPKRFNEWMGHANPLVTFRRYVRGRVGAGDRGRAATDILPAGIATVAKSVWKRKAV